AALGGEERDPGDRLRLGGRLTVCVRGAASRQVPDDELLDPDNDLAGSRRTAAGQRAAGQLQLAVRPGGIDPLVEESLEPRLVLVHLRELPVRPVALDELALAGDRLGVRLGVLRRPDIALDALAVIRAVIAAERGEAPVPELPDPRHGGVQEGAVVRRDEE